MLIIKQITVKEAEKVFEIQQKAYASLLKNIRILKPIQGQRH